MPNLRTLAPGLLLAGLLWLVFKIMAGFLPALAWAAVLAYSSWPLRQKVLAWLGGRANLAALLLTLSLTLVLIAPVIWGSLMLRYEIQELLRQAPHWLEQKPSLPNAVARLPLLGQELERILQSSDDFRTLISERLTPWLRQFTGALLAALGDVGYNAALVGFSLLTLFFFFRDGPEIGGQIRRVLERLLGERAHRYLDTVETTVRAVVYGVVLTAIAQGAVAGLGYWAVGVKAPMLMTLITMLFALVPFGTPFVWGGVGLGLLAREEYWAAVTLIAWGALVVSWIDNIVRPWVISGATRIPFLLVFFGVLGGLAQFGFIGLFTGPVVLAVALAVWREWSAHGDEDK